MFSRKLLNLSLLLALFSCSTERFTNTKNLSVSQPALAAQNTDSSSKFLGAIRSNIIPFTANTESAIDTKSLAAFADRISNVRVLGLGEQTHGAGSVFSLKVELIKYLHQKHDFDLFILESGLYDVEKIYQQAKKGQRIKDMAPGNIFYMYANSEEVTPLFDYIDEQATTSNPLKLVGFDSQHTGKLSNKGLVADLSSALKKLDKKKVLSKDWSEFSNQIKKILNGSLVRMPLNDENAFFAQFDMLAEKFSSANEGFWFRITKGLAAQAKRQWGIEDNRSLEMGENVKWWAEQFPDKKIIVWAHTWHLTKEGNKEVNAGQVISEHFKEQYYMVHFTGEKGKYLDYVDMSLKEVESLTPNSLEGLISQYSSAPINFVDVTTLPLEKNKRTVFSNDYQQKLTSSEWGRYFDGVFILKNITPTAYLR